MLHHMAPALESGLELIIAVHDASQFTQMLSRVPKVQDANHSRKIRVQEVLKS